MANKKINQLVSKTAILSTDIFGIGDATTGQLFKKTIAELQAAIGGAVISVNGLVGTVVLDTDDIQELATPTNKYFTDARARGAISLTVTGNSGASTYSSGTGVLNVPTYTLAGLGGITASFLSGTSGISYNSTTGVISYSGTVYTDASIRALFSAGTGITYNSTTGAISYSGTVYTDSSVRALISMTTTGTSGASTYNNTTGVINVPNYTLAGLGGISLTSLSGGTGITYNSSTGAISYSGTVYTDASIRGLFSASGSVSYNNTTGVISLTGGNLTEATSSVLTITGGTGAVIGGGTSIQVKQATTSVSGFLLSTDWTTFNNKQATISLTTTGTSGAATFTSNTLNIPNYGSALSGYLPLTGGTLTGALGGTSATFSAQGGSGSVINISLADAGYQTIGITSTTGTNAVGIRMTNTGGSAYFGLDNSTGGSFGAGAYHTVIAAAGTNPITLLVNNGATKALSIASTGAATFSSSVSVNGASAISKLNVIDGFVSVGSSANTTTANTLLSGYGYILSGTTYGNVKITSSYNNGNNQAGLEFYTDNTGVATEKMRITSAGNVGIGTTALVADALLPIQINAVATTGQAYFASNNNGSYGLLIGYDNANGYARIRNVSNTALTFETNNVERMRITSAGNVGIGTTSIRNNGSGQTAMQITGADYPIFSINGANNGIGAVLGIGSSTSYIGTYSAHGFSIVTADTERMRITSGGNILMGTTTDNGERLYVNGTIRATGTITANSDITLKKNLLKIENALEKVEQINGYTYEFKEDDSKRHAGVIAQEIQTVLPEIVNKGNDGILGVEYGNISALLIEAIKEQQTQINELKALLNK